MMLDRGAKGSSRSQMGYGEVQAKMCSEVLNVNCNKEYQIILVATQLTYQSWGTIFLPRRLYALLKLFL